MTVRLHLTADDVARVRFVPHARPMDDTVAVVRCLLAGHRSLHPALDPARVALLTDLMDRCWPAFASSPCSSLDAGLEALVAAPARQLARDFDDVVAYGEPVPRWAPQLLEARSGRRVEVAAAYRHVYQVMVEPYAAVLADHQERGHRVRMQRLANDGLGSVLNGLHPSIRWSSSVLELDIPDFDFDIQLDGRGLILQPSGLITDPAVTHDDLDAVDTTVVYPVARPAPAEAGMPAVASAALAAVIGQTRANALVRLAQEPGATTTSIAVGLDVSAATASEQLSLLRAAGLTRRIRKGPAVSHSLTPLGWSLVTASRPDQAAAASAGRR